MAGGAPSNLTIVLEGSQQGGAPCAALSFFLIFVKLKKENKKIVKFLRYGDI